jgi:hypothetical protein
VSTLPPSRSDAFAAVMTNTSRSPTDALSRHSRSKHLSPL